MAVPFSREAVALATNGSAANVEETRFTQAWQVIFTFKVTDEGAIVSFSCLNLSILNCRAHGKQRSAGNRIFGRRCGERYAVKLRVWTDSSKGSTAKW